MSIINWWEKYSKKIPITMLTAYDAQFAQLIDDCDVDGILVGDSLRHTFYGENTTIGMTLDDMVYHTKAVSNGAKNSFIISDMPFMTCNISVEETLKNATVLIQAGAHAVKCEVRESNFPYIKRMVQEGIQVMGHIGLQPQYINEIGGYALQGTSDNAKEKLMGLAKKLSDIGVFAIVLEKVTIELAKTVTEQINCPTIGIGAGPYCSGQVLVINDLLGLTTGFHPKFLKTYCNGAELFKAAISEFKSDVESQRFPTEGHGYQ